MFNNPQLSLFKKLKPVLLPMIWFDEVNYIDFFLKKKKKLKISNYKLFKDIRLNQDILNQLGQVGLIAKLCVIIPIVMLCFGIFWFVFAVGLRIHVNKLMNSKKVIIYLMNE